MKKILKEKPYLRIDFIIGKDKNSIVLSKGATQTISPTILFDLYKIALEKLTKKV